ncbi:MAG: glycosyltransferase [Bryobacteraceae bacterium]|nr:glycosyltransferase [Bryobacteraceae bacterium]
MRILHCNATLHPSWGGPVEHLRQTAEAMARLGHHAEFLSLDSPGDPCLRSWTHPVHAIGEGWTKYGFAPVSQWFRKNADRYDAVFVHTLWRHLGAGVREGVRGSGTPYFVKPHGGLNAWHRSERGGSLAKRTFKQAAWKLSEWKVVRDAEAMIFVCDEERRQAAASYRPYVPRREEVVTNGIGHPPSGAAAQAEAFFSAYPDLRGRDLLLFLGRLHPDKACDNLLLGLSAAARGSGIHLVIAGPDVMGWLAELRRLAAKEGIEKQVTWAGSLEGDFKWAAIRAASALILPSHSEAMPYSILEALSCSRPVLTTEKVGIVADLREARCGFIAADTVEGAAELIGSWASAGPEERRALSDRAYALFTDKYYIDTAMERQLKIVRESKPLVRSHSA